VRAVRRGAARRGQEQRERVGAVGPGVIGENHRRQQLVRAAPFVEGVEGVEGEQLLAQPGALAAREGGEEGGGENCPGTGRPSSRGVAGRAPPCAASAARRSWGGVPVAAAGRPLA